MRPILGRFVCPLLLVLFACSPAEKSKRADNGKEAFAGRALGTINGWGHVEVELSGIVALMDYNNNRRAVVVRDPHGRHTPLLTMPDSYKSFLESVFTAAKVSCDALRRECHADLSGGAIVRVIGTDNAVPINRYQPKNFHDPLVPGLQGLGIKKESLHEDLKERFPTATGPAVAWFDLNGGEAIPTPYGCKARFKGESNYRPFNAAITVSLITDTKARLQIRTTRNGQWQTLPVTASYLKIKLSNNSPSAPDTSHFHLFGQLTDPVFTELPEVEREGDACTFESGTVPGCGNSQWP